MKFQIGDRIFPSKSAAKKAVQKVLNKWPIGVAITGDDLDFLMEGVVGMHNNAQEKIGCGIARIEVRLNTSQQFKASRGF